MRYSEVVTTAPPGSRRFRPADLARLGRTALGLLLAPGPSAPPLDDVAVALGDQPAALLAVAAALPPARGEHLLRLAERPATPERRRQAGEQLVRGAFWYLAYELTPGLWDRLATAEPVAADLVADLPADGARVLEVGAGSGRLTGPLAGRAAALVAVEPCPPLRRLLHERHPGVLVLAGVGHRLPVAAGWADLVTACATFGPHPPLGGESVRAELERCARPGGTVALVSPENPAWWERRGYQLRTYARPAPRRDPELEDFFGPLRPPHQLAWRRVGEPAPPCTR